MAGTLVIDTIQDGSGNSTGATNAIKGSAKAWANFNGTTSSIRAAHNVSSITRNATGDYTLNFTTALADSNYCAVYGGGDSTSNFGRSFTSSSTTQHRFVTRNTNNGSAIDDTQVFAAIFR